ncbi:MAG: winged helix-turn-helix domain-containing protein [Thermoanaerobaculaceae bacterium]|jgi:hypothetical protein|nr:winged helix-turn-helix domain-containing protein [Thermoanaerobaculaceae bacterium]
MVTIEEIGTAAGVVWRLLKASGPATLYAIERGAALPRPLVPLALGWLAREGKLQIQEDEGTVRYSVTD